MSCWTLTKVNHYPWTGRGLCPVVCGSVVRDRRHEKESGTDMKGKIVCRIFSLCCAAIFVLLLTGCDPTAGAANYEVINALNQKRGAAPVPAMLCLCESSIPDTMGTLCRFFPGLYGAACSCNCFWKGRRTECFHK